MPTTTPLKWHGGKSYLASWIIQHFPPHLIYCEPYFGGGQVLFARDPNKDWLIDDAWKLQNGEKVPAHLKGCSEVICDIDSQLTTFWKVLQNKTKFAEFEHLVMTTPFSQTEWKETAKILKQEDGYTDVQIAHAFFTRYRQSRQGLGSSFATLTKARTRGRINEQANSWWGAVDGLIEAHRRLEGVVILEAQHAINVIKANDSPHTLFYLDPPYVQETRVSKAAYGPNEMSQAQHAELLAVLSNAPPTKIIDHLKMRKMVTDPEIAIIEDAAKHKLQGRFILSGYQSTIYAIAEQESGWSHHIKSIDNKASSAKNKDQKAETIWMNN